MSELMCSQSKCRRKDEHIAELKTENAELRDENRVMSDYEDKLRYETVNQSAVIKNQQSRIAELAALKEAAQALYDSKFKDPKTGNQCVAFCELEKMAALLQEKGE